MIDKRQQRIILSFGRTIIAPSEYTIKVIYYYSYLIYVFLVHQTGYN